MQLQLANLITVTGELVEGRRRCKELIAQELFILNSCGLPSEQSGLLHDSGADA